MYYTNPINLATSQPGVFILVHQMFIGGCNVDDNTKLLFKTTQPDLACRLDLNERPYKAVPFMGRGPVCSDTESQLQQGDTISSKKSVGTISDQSYLNYSNYPLISSIESKVTNPSNLIEESAQDGWIRGGIPSRDIYRDNEYFNSKK